MYLADKNWGPDNMLCSQIVYKFVVEYDLTLVQFFLFLKKSLRRDFKGQSKTSTLSSPKQIES